MIKTRRKEKKKWKSFKKSLVFNSFQNNSSLQEKMKLGGGEEESDRLNGAGGKKVKDLTEGKIERGIILVFNKRRFFIISQINI